MEFQINLSRLGLKGKGLGDISYASQGVSRSALPFNSGGLNSNRTSYLGTQIFSDLVLENIPKNGITQLRSARFDAMLIDVVQTKNIVTTAVVGREGTIKEYIADGDYQVTLKGAIIMPESNDYPEEAVRVFIQLLKRNETLKPISDYLRLFDISQLVVTDYSFSQKVGQGNVQYFEVSCISDLPENLIIDA